MVWVVEVFLSPHQKCFLSIWFIIFTRNSNDFMIYGYIHIASLFYYIIEHLHIISLHLRIIGQLNAFYKVKINVKMTSVIAVALRIHSTPIIGLTTSWKPAPLRL